MVCFYDVLCQFADLSVHLEEIQINILHAIYILLEQCCLMNVETQNIVFLVKTKNLLTIFLFILFIAK